MPGRPQSLGCYYHLVELLFWLQWKKWLLDGDFSFECNFVTLLCKFRKRMIANSLAKIQEELIFKNRILHFIYPELLTLTMREDMEAIATFTAGYSEEHKAR